MLTRNTAQSLSPRTEFFTRELPPRAPAIAHPEQLPESTFVEMLQTSKYMSRLLSQGGPISNTPLLAIINPLADTSDNYASSSPGVLRKRLIPPAIGNLTAEAPLNCARFAERFISGEFPAELVFKPDGSSGGNGVFKVRRTDHEIIILIRNPEDRILQSQRRIVEYARLNSECLLSAISPATYEIRIPRSAGQEPLSQICTHALFTEFPHESDTRFGYTDINAGLVEESVALLAPRRQMIEGRYYCVFKDLRLALASSREADGTPIRSYLKGGVDEHFVNGGTVLADWPEMHQPIISALDLGCTQGQFTSVMCALVLEQAGVFLQNLASLWEEPGSFFGDVASIGYIIDVGWDPSIMIPYGDNDGEIITIPRPVLIEMTTHVRWNPSLLADS